MLDCSSQRSYISESLRKNLEVPPKGKQVLSVFLFGRKQPKQMSTLLAEVNVHCNDGTRLTMDVNVEPVIMGNKPSSGISLSKVALRDDIKLSDDIPSDPIDVLVGNDHYYDLVKLKVLTQLPGLYLLDTKVGWILTGRSGCVTNGTETVSFLTAAAEPRQRVDSIANNIHWVQPSVIPEYDEQEKDSIKHLWELDVLGIRDSPLRTEDDMSIQSFKNSITFQEGRYFVSWPYRSFPPQLPTNYGLSMGRLKALLKRLTDPKILGEYNRIIQEQLDLKIIEKVTADQRDGVVHYLPHHAVLTPEKSTTKVRIVFDASSKARKSEKSLNECLFRGRVLLEDIVYLLLRFRLHKFAVTADIEKAFLQIGLHKEDRDVTRFLWLKDTSKQISSDNLQIFRFTRVAFGVISSPFLLAAVVRFHLLRIDTAISKKIANNVYVDNVVTGCGEEREVMELYAKGREIFSEANMNLREWKSNTSYFIQNINGSNSTTVLGMTWDIQEDTLCVKAKRTEPCWPLTKRKISSYLASFFDPLGFMTPLLISAKVFLQGLWKKGLEWNDELPPEMRERWEKVKNNLGAITGVQVPRFVGTSNEVRELHCFCDASQEAYATAIYLRFTNHCQLIFAKARVAPLGGVTIPRMELLAVLIGVRAVAFVGKGLEIQVKKKLWTDSQCVLHWIKSDRLQPLFIENRLKEIREATKTVTFCYISSEDNPADLATRSNSVAEISAQWWNGPEWLKLHEKYWPSYRMNAEIESIEYPRLHCKMGIELQPPTCPTLLNLGVWTAKPFLIDETKYSCYKTLIAITAYCQRFINKCRKRSVEYGVTSVEEVGEAIRMWERYVQIKHFEDTLKSIKAGKRTTLQSQLGLWVDVDGILRCKGRVVHKDFDFAANYPKLLPSCEYFTILVVRKVHWSLAHAGVAHTLAEVRKTYWILKGRSTVRRVLSSCQICKVFGGGPFKLPEMSDLPLARITKDVAFTYTGVDYLGPLYVKTNCGNQTVWITLFACMVTRGLHLEIVEGLSSVDFMLALRRFVGRRGVPKMIISDNAPQFHATKSVLDEVWKNINSDSSLREYCAHQNIIWRFIPALAPWAGGAYERLVAMVKMSIRKTVGKLHLTRVQLGTVIVEIEATLNSRPLVYIGDDINSNNYLTPAHFLGVRGATTLSLELQTERLSKEKTTVIEAWRRGQEYLEEFWRIWKEEYLASLRERTQREVKQKKGAAFQEPKLGSIVLIGDKTPRGKWRLGKIIETPVSEDGSIRVAKVLLAGGRKLTRSIGQLYPTELSS